MQVSNIGLLRMASAVIGVLIYVGATPFGLEPIDLGFELVPRESTAVE